jgi:hypothetical protein
MGEALWISWYDLQDDRREAYLDWCHARYIPRLLERRGYLWAAHYASVDRDRMTATHPDFVTPTTADAAVPTGDRYILMVAGEDANVFGDPVPSALHAGLPQEDRAMLGMRTGERVNVMVEAARVDGPSAKTYAGGATPGPCIQIGSYNCDPAAEEEMLAWYAQWRMAAMRTLPGCIRTRKLASVSGWAKHGVIYEFDSVEIRNRHYPRHEADRPDMKAWTKRMVLKLTHAPGSANLAERIWPAVSKY